MNVIVVGLNSGIANGAIQVFPNPANQHLVLQVPTEASSENYTVFDITGKMQLSGRLDGMETVIDLSKLAVGMYNLQVGSGNSQRISFVKQ
ncbi:MAG: Secretion system C-terminal sorting domain [Bacteroidota bacterium]|jgi:hypothetical protein